MCSPIPTPAAYSQLLAGVERANLRHALYERFTADAPGRKVLGPQQKIGHRSVHLAVADLLPRRLVHIEATLAWRVAAREPRQAGGVTIDDRRVLHAERAEDVLGGKLLHGATADALHDRGEQQIAGVAVLVLRARCEIGTALAAEQLDRFKLRGAVLETPPFQQQQALVVAQSADVMQQVTHGHATCRSRQLRNVLDQRIVDR